jgi:hypothetical protein
MEVKQKYYFSTFEQMGLNKKQLKEASKPLYSFRGKKIEPMGSISLPVSLGMLSNAHTEYISFDMVDMCIPTMPSSEGVSLTPLKLCCIHSTSV